ncbi:MAG: hypothetical protein ACJA2H_000691 [Nitriliruptoraceae bacterium]|jgi:hypothetical protein
MMLATICAALVLAVFPASGAAARTGDTWPSWSHTFDGEFRTGAYESGEWVYRNGIGQAMGPNVDGLYREDYFASIAAGPASPSPDIRGDVYRHVTYGAFGFDRSTHNGDYELPQDRTTWPDFTADVAVLAAQVDDDELFLRFRFTSMPAADAQIATLTFATAGTAPASTAWPQGAGVTSPWSAALTMWGTDGRLDTASGTSGLSDAGGAIRATTDERLWEVRLPLAALPAAPWQLTGGAGLADPADPSTYWDVPAGRSTTSAPGSGANDTSDANVWSLLFAETDDWQHDERHQSDLLADGEVGAATTTLDPQVLRARTDSAEAARTGRLSRFFQSAADLGDGIGRSGGGVPTGYPFVPPPGADLRDPAVSYSHRNDLQPALLYVPAACTDGGCPLIVWLHGVNNYPFEPFGMFLGLEELLEERGYVLAAALGRGDLGYTGAGELDVLEVIADMRATYDVDPQRIHVMGLSMGSIGAQRLATLYPDRFATVSGFTLAGGRELLPNLRHVPHLISHGQQDFFDPGGRSTSRIYDDLSALGYDTQYYDWLQKTHESATFYDIGVPLFDRLDAAAVPTSPAEITFVRPIDTASDVELGLVRDTAYWLRGIVARDPATTGRVDARSYALSDPLLDSANATRTSAPDPGLELRSGRGAHTLNITVPAFIDAAAAQNRLTFMIDGLASIVVDTSRAGLVLDGLVVETAGDGATLTFEAADGSETATIDGTPIDVVHADGTVALRVPSGDHVVVFTAAAAAVLAASASGPALAATGGGLAGLGLLGVAAGAVLRRRRR